MAVTAVLLAGCGLITQPDPAQETIRVTPADGERGVRASGLLKVSVSGGWLERVEVTRRDAPTVAADPAAPERIAGRFSDNRRTWRPDSPRLKLSSRYSVRAVAVDDRGRRTVRRTGFSTHIPRQRLIGHFTPEHGQTVGTGMIVSLNFTHPVADRAAVERRIRVTAKPAVEVAAHWFGDRRLDFRPETYWHPGTEVTLDLRLRDVRAGPGTYGVQQKKVRFTIGRDQRSVADTRRRTMTVLRGGRPVRKLPITAGTREFATYNGVMVISAKYPKTRMDSATVGLAGEYDYADVPHAMRLTSSGTFVHGNYWADPEVFGNENVSHGCVGLEDTRGGSRRLPAGWFYERSLIGDVIEVRNSSERTVAPDNGLSGWNMAWPTWRTGSAK
jgi:lipoprotein-anchoring transpeptidase ErfK/SrfK